MLIVMVPAASIYSCTTLAVSAATSVHNVLHLADTLCENLYFSSSCSILKGIVMCFHAHTIIFMGLLAVKISNVMFLWAWSLVTVIIDTLYT